MLVLTALDGTPVKIDPKLVNRARRAVSGERTGLGARTRIDGAQVQLVKEPIAEVAAALSEKLGAEFTHVTSRDGSRIWFRGAVAEGPLSLTPSETAIDGVQSSLRIMGYRQYVAETPDEVRAILTAAGATVFP
jgi:hypothetical protein